jgi:hypothetical protein
LESKFLTDLSPLLKVSARLLDLHDSGRSPGGGTQYQLEDRSGNGDGRYVCIAGEVLVTLQASGKQSGDEFSSVDHVAQSVRAVHPWANELDVEFVLNVLSRPTELKLLQHDEDSSHVIGDKETNLVEKAAHMSEYRLSRLGRKALAMATENLDLAYIEGDVTKLLRALETGRLNHALSFLERLIDQLRAEQLTLISIIEKTAGGRKVIESLFDDIAGFEATLRRAAELVNQALARVDALARGNDIHTDDVEVPFGKVKEKVRELQRGIVGYARSLSVLATKSMAVTSTSVEAPSFTKFAMRMVVKPQKKMQTDFILGAMGPVFPLVTFPMGTDLRGSIKVKAAKVSKSVAVDLGEYFLPPEDRFIEWMKKHQGEFNDRIRQGRLTLEDAIMLWTAEEGREGDLGCLIAAMTSPDEWLTIDGVTGSMDSQLTISSLPGVAVMNSYLALTVSDQKLPEEASHVAV